MLDELGDLAGLAIDTFRQLLTDESAPASVRLKAAMEIAKLVESQRPTLRETTLTAVITAVKCDRLLFRPHASPTWAVTPPAPAAVRSNTNAAVRIPSRPELLEK